MNIHIHSSSCSNAMNMAPAIEFWSHCLGHFVSVLHCRVCACGSYGGGDTHKGGGGRMTQEVSPLLHQQNEMLEGWTQGTSSDLCMYSSKAFATSSVCHNATPKS